MHIPTVLASDPTKDLTRKVYCVLGLPIEALGMSAILNEIDVAAAGRLPFLVSTPNLNFLVNSRSDPEFWESVLDSDLCPADGMPIVWIARLLGLPINKRVSGSDIFETLRLSGSRGLKVFFFGGEKGVAAAAASALNAARGALSCVGTLTPGFGTVDDMSGDDVFATINASGADILIVSLGARKGQVWLHRNHDRITVPIRAHLGAVINFIAGTVKRAPVGFRAFGLEWLWRIKEEPRLWRRYTHDGVVLLLLVFTRALPLAVRYRWYRFRSHRKPKELLISIEERRDSLMVKVAGDANERNIDKAVARFREAFSRRNRAVVIDFTGTRVVDARFLGLLLMVRKRLNKEGTQLKLIGMSSAIRKVFWLNGPDFLFRKAIDMRD
jgi:N-acetylglucosaminyldiphosphoundecaprenol N-acetyl-beta-D-mannosaminyltransferase